MLTTYIMPDITSWPLSIASKNSNICSSSTIRYIDEQNDDNVNLLVQVCIIWWGFRLQCKDLIHSMSLRMPQQGLAWMLVVNEHQHDQFGPSAPTHWNLAYTRIYLMSSIGTIIVRSLLGRGCSFSSLMNHICNYVSQFRLQ